MSNILCNPLNQTISVFDLTITNARTRIGSYAKREEKAFVFIDRKRVIEDDRETYQDKTCILLKNKPNKDSMILPETTIETDVNGTNAQYILSIANLTNHNGEIEGYEVVLK